MPHQQRDRDRSCRSVVMAAFEAIEDACGEDRNASSVDQDTVVMAPRSVKDQASRVEAREAADSEIERIINEEEWLEEWTKAMCKQSGVEPDDPNWRTCRRRWARRVMDGL